MSELDRTKLAKVLSMVGSGHAGEAVSALGLANGMLRRAGVTWAELLAPKDDSVPREAAIVLAAENAALRAEIEQLRASAAPWAPAGVPAGKESHAARWALQLHGDGELNFTPWEISFLQRCSRWKGPLTVKQRPPFDRIMDMVALRTGQAPPT